MPLKADMLDPIGAQPAAAAADLSFASKETVNVASPLAAVADAAPISAAEAETATVIHINSPEDFYILPTACLTDYQAILEASLESSGRPLATPLHIGQLCLAEEEGISHRARLDKISPDGSKVKLFFLDSGRRATRQVSELQQLPAGLERPGLARQVGLAGLAAGPDGWTQAVVDKFCLLVDMENETMFRVHSLGLNEAGVETVRMVDEENNNLTELCLEMGIGSRVHIEGKCRRTYRILL